MYNRERQIDRKRVHLARRRAIGQIEEVHTTGTKLAQRSSNGEASCKIHTKEGSKIEEKRHGGWENGRGRNWDSSSGRARARGRGKSEGGGTCEVLDRGTLTVWLNQEKGRLAVSTKQGNLSMLEEWQSSKIRAEIESRRHGSGDLGV